MSKQMTTATTPLDLSREAYADSLSNADTFPCESGKCYHARNGLECPPDPWAFIIWSNCPQ